MKYILISCFIFFALNVSLYGQNTTSFTDKYHFSTETTVGFDPVYRIHLGWLLKYNVLKNITLSTQTNMARSYRSMGEIVSIPSDDFKSINFTFTQRFGAGAVIGKERFSHTFLLMVGPQYYLLSENHSYSQFEKASLKVSTWYWDAGFLYSFKIGSQKTYFTSQFYLPFLLIPDNLMGVTLSLGFGIQFNN